MVNSSKPWLERYRALRERAQTWTWKSHATVRLPVRDQRTFKVDMNRPQGGSRRISRGSCNYVTHIPAFFRGLSGPRPSDLSLNDVNEPISGAIREAWSEPFVTPEFAARDWPVPNTCSGLRRRGSVVFSRLRKCYKCLLFSNLPTLVVAHGLEVFCAPKLVMS